MKLIEQEKNLIETWEENSLDFEIFNYVLFYYESYLKTQTWKLLHGDFFRFSHKKETHFTMAEFDSKLSFP